MLRIIKQIKNFIGAAAALAAIISMAAAPFPVRLLASAPVPASVEMRGLWVTSAYNLDWPSQRGLSNQQLRNEIDDILERAAAQGINAVFVQVRPSADAFYRSEIFPWSHLLTGTQGQAPAEGFDPLEYWIERAHALGIEVHAWLNPYRITFRNQNITDPSLLSAEHPARLSPGLVIAYNNSLFFDPGNPAAHRLILDGVAELLRNYNLDGIHLDDYFYPSPNFPDQNTFLRYGGGMDIHDWRRENVNTLIRDLQSIVRENCPRARFGVSPFAIWKNDDTDPRGSATRGVESYHRMYADTRRWVLEGWVDYIVPQIYWYEGFGPACYEAVLTWWEELASGTDVNLYIGLAVYREVDGRPGWSGEIMRQIERNARSEVVRGNIFFRERHMRSAVGEQIAAFHAANRPTQAPPPPIIELPPVAPLPDPPAVIMDRLLVSQPANNRNIIDANGFWVHGSGVPGVPVYVNGRLITDRTAEGFFSVFLPLVRGENSFTFTQEGRPSITRVITNNPPAPPPPPVIMAQAGVVNAFPATDEWARAGTTLTLRVSAPAGAAVSVEIGGQTLQMTQTNPNLAATANNIVQAQFTASLTLSAEAPPDAIIDIGRPVYTMTWNGQTRTATSSGHIRQLGFEAPFFAEITTDSAWVFPQAGTAGGSNWVLLNGQTDRVSAITGDWTRLASGGWVESENLRTWRDSDFVPPMNAGTDLGFLSEGMYIPGELEDVITWEVPFFPAMQAEFDGQQLIVALGMQQTAPPIFHNIDQTLFSDITIGVSGGAPAYFMQLREGERLEGFYFEHENGRLRLILRRRRPLTPGNFPLAGFRFVLDAGHGGVQPGAVGPMGGLMPESHIVMTQALLLQERLEMLGAEVIQVRTTDVDISLQARVDLSREHKPDMFISLHTNSTAESTDATNIRGFTVWYRNPASRPAASSFMNSMYNVNPATNRNRAPNQANFFVVRPVWAPSILLEASFTNNIHDFSWLINGRRQVDYAWSVVNALLRYYSE